MKIQYIDKTNLAYCNGYKFRKDKKSGYWLCTTLHKRLHRYIYELENGEIPKGYEVHHIDHNKDNNDISNLQLMTKSEHSKLHNKLSEEEKEKRRINLNINARPKAIEWHKTKEAKEWHKKHYEKMKDKLYIEHNYTCKYCGKEFKSVQINSKFCSNICKSKWRRKNKLDEVEELCVICGNKFMTNKYRKAKTCSNSCASKFRWVNKNQ